MRLIRGRLGGLYSVSFPFRFSDLLLEDCGDGFDWRASDRAMGYWLSDDQAAFRFKEMGVWHDIEPVEVHYRMGRVGFGKCLRGLEVRADGVCLPLTQIATLDGWELHMEMQINAGDYLGGETKQVEVKQVGASALLRGVTCDRQEAVVRLSPVEEGAFVGTGTVTCDATNGMFRFDEKGVTYEPR